MLRSLLVLVLVGVVGLTACGAETSTPGAGEELDASGRQGATTEGAATAGDEEDVEGWRASGSGSIEAVDDDLRGTVVRLASDGTADLKLDDVEPTVGRTSVGDRYRVTVGVRSPVPRMSGRVRVREVAPSGTHSHSTPFHLDGATWQDVEVEVTVGCRGAALDVSVVASTVTPGAEILVDVVKVEDLPANPGAMTSCRPVSEAATTDGCWVDARGLPACGAYVGAAVGGNAPPEDFEAEVGSRLGVRRTFYGPHQVDWAVRTAEEDLGAGRLPWISFKLPHSWSEMAAGAGDAWAADIAARLDRLGGPVWIAFHHEPEGDGDIEEWVAVQRRLAPLVRQAADNVAYSIIVTGWHQLHGGPEYALDRLWPGDGLVDLVGFDLYNAYGNPTPGGTNLEHTDLAEVYFPYISSWTREHSVAWALAETGYTDAAAADDPEWLRRTYDDVLRFGGVALTYFNSALNSDVPLLLDGGVKTAEFADVLARSPKLELAPWCPPTRRDRHQQSRRRARRR